MTTQAQNSVRRISLDTAQLLLLGIIGFISVVSSPRLMLLEVSSLPNIPVEFRIVALSLPDYFVITLLLISALRAALDAPYRQHLSETLNLVVARLGGLWWFGLVVWMALGMLWASEPVMVRYSTLHAIAVLAMAALAADLLRKPGVGQARQTLLLLVLLASAAAQSILAVLQVINQGPLGLSALGEIPRLYYETTAFYRAPGLAMHPNYLGGYLMVALFACAVVAGGAPANRRALLALPAALIGLGLVATLSRSAILSMAFGALPLLAAVFFSVRGQIRLIMLGAVAVTAAAGMLAAWVVLGGSLEAIQTRFFSPREFFFADSWRVIQESPIIGAGAGNLMIEVGRIRGPDSVPELLPVHNVYLYLWAELGLPGLALFLLGCASVLWRLRPRLGADLFIWTSCFLAMCVVMLFDNYFWAVHPFRVFTFWVLGLWWGCASRAVTPEQAQPQAA